jgi:two-component system nitrogen regulation response regulator NtrX
LAEKAKILIVDDDENIRKTMKAILEEENYSVDLATNGKEAIQMTNEKMYNLALLDIRLPDIEGVELLQLMKEYVPRTRKIMVTGYPTIQNAVMAINKNADAYLLKPVDIEKLLQIVKEQLRAQEEERSFSEEKVAEFIEARVRNLSINNV